ncbi:hypothetical protein Tco_0506714 [Tanacetum coccineum]
MANLKYSDKHNMVAFLKKPNGSDDFHEIVDFLKRTPLRYALTHNPTIYDSLVKQFWQTATVRTIANGNQELLATIDGKAYTITEASVKSSLQLADATCITNLLDAEIHDGLAIMRFLQMILGIRTANTGQHIAPVLTKKIFGNMKRGFEGNHVPLLPAMLAPAQGEGSAILAGSQPTPTGPTPTPVADEATTTSVEVDAEGAATTTASLEAGLDSGNIHESPLRSHDAPLPEVNTSESVDDSVKLKELMELVPKLMLQIDSLEKELIKTTRIFRNEVLTLKNRVKTLKVALKRKSKKVVLSELEGEEVENSSKHGRKVASGGVSTYKRRRRSVDIGMDYFSAAKERTKSEEVNTGSIGVNTCSTPDKAQRKGKAKMVEEDVQTDIIRAKLEANAELVKNMQGEDLSKIDFSKRMVDMVNQRKKYFAEERAKAKRTTKARMKRYSEELQTGTSNKQKTVDDLGFAELQEKVAAKDVPVTEEKTRETSVPKEEEVEKSTKIKRRRLKTKARKGLNVDKDAQEDSETDKEEDMEAISAFPVDTKSPSVVNWKIFQQGQRSIYQIIRANGADIIYMSFGAMLKDIIRDDLTELYRTMFEPPLSEDAIWSLPLQQKMLNWSYAGYEASRRKQNEECYQLLKLIEKQSKKTLP